VSVHRLGTVSADRARLGLVWLACVMGFGTQFGMVVLLTCRTFATTLYIFAIRSGAMLNENN
jgi:hypothetical protein